MNPGFMRLVARRRAESERSIWNKHGRLLHDFHSLPDPCRLGLGRSRRPALQPLSLKMSEKKEETALLCYVGSAFFFSRSSAGKTASIRRASPKGNSGTLGVGGGKSPVLEPIAAGVKALDGTME